MRYKTREELRQAFIEIGSQEGTTKVVHKRCAHYAKYYSDKFFEYQDSDINFFELGAHTGCSARMWSKLFPKWTLTYLDNDERYTSNPHEPPRRMPENAPVYVGDQGDKDLLKKVIKERGPFDIILDDASHDMVPTWQSFEGLFMEGLKSPGIYIIEDMHTSYWPCSQGGLKKPGSSIENLKNLVDEMSFSSHVAGVPSNTPPEFSTRLNDLASELQKSITEVSFCPDIGFIYKGNNCVGRREDVEHPGITKNV